MGTVSVLVGVLSLAIFLALFDSLTPSGRVTDAGRVVEVTPKLTGQIVAIPVETNVLVKTGDVLFQIDPALFSTRSRSCKRRSPQQGNRRRAARFTNDMIFVRGPKEH
jgi:multidrug resistance efflux pump